MNFQEWFDATTPENRDAANMLRSALEKNHQFALVIEAPSSRLVLHNQQDGKASARLLEKVARWQRGMEPTIT